MNRHFSFVNLKRIRCKDFYPSFFIPVSSSENTHLLILLMTMSPPVRQFRYFTYFLWVVRIQNVLILNKSHLKDILRENTIF